MKKVAIIIILLVSDFCNAQSVSDNKLSYYGELSKEANKEYPNSPYEVIDLDSLFNFIFSEGKAKIKMDTSSNWKLLFEIKTEWTHDVRNEREIQIKIEPSSYEKEFVKELFEVSSDSIHLVMQEEYRTKILKTNDSSYFPQTNISHKSIKFIYDSSKVYYGKELFLGLEIDSMFLNNAPKPWLKMWKHETDSLKYFPQVHERNDPLNRIWMPIICEDYLILRFVHSYPDGNETSFYRESVLLFKKENI